MKPLVDSQDRGIRNFLLMERVLFLKGVELFKNIDTEKLMVIARIAQEVTFRKGEVVSRQNDVGDALYIIKSGSLRVTREKGGQVTVLSHLGGGDTYGTWGLFSEHPRSATAEANEDSVLLMLHRSEFREVLDENPEISYNMLQIFSELLLNANNEIALLNNILSEKIKTERIKK